MHAMNDAVPAKHPPAAADQGGRRWRRPPGRLARRFLSGVLLALAGAHAALAGEFPDKPVTIISPFAPGGADLFLRIVAPKLGEQLGQPVVIENVPGAGGILGAERVMHAPPDGYTLLFAPSSVTVTAKFLSANMRFDILKDFTPISLMHETPQVLFVPGDLPVNSVAELIHYAKQRPGKLAYGSAGIGSVMQFNAELFKMESGTDILHVPFKGISPMNTEILGGRVAMGFSTLASVAPFAKAGKLKVLAALDARRLPFLPDTPAITETLPGFRTVGTWSSLLGPAGMPKAIQERLTRAMSAVLAMPDVKRSYDLNYGLIIAGSPADLTRRLQSEIAQTTRIADTAGIRAE